MPRYRAQISSTDSPPDSTTYEFIHIGCDSEAILMAKGHFFNDNWGEGYLRWQDARLSNDTITWQLIAEGS